MRSHRSALSAVALASVALVLAACSSAAPTVLINPTQAPASAAASVGPRPSSPAVVTILQPTNGAQLSGSTVHVVLSLTGATIVTQTTTSISPTEGHVHLLVDNVVVSMNYGLEQDIPVHPGTYVLKAEFVAADHAPYSPRVFSPEVFFTVKG